MLEMMRYIPILAEEEGGLNGVGNLIDNVQKTLGNWGSIIVSIIGIVMVIVGVYQVAKNFMSKGQGQTNWFVTIALIVVGGIFAITGGWATIGKWVDTGKNTLDQLQNEADDQHEVTDPFENNGGGNSGDGN